MPGTSRDRPGLLVLLVVFCFLLTSLAAAAATWTGGSPTDSHSLPGLLPASISVGNSAAVACSDVDTCTTPAVTGLDAGDALVVVVTNHDGFGGTPSSVDEVTSGGDNALTRLGNTACNGMSHGAVAVYGLANVAAQTSVTFKVDYGGNEYYTVHALDVHGTAPTPFESAGAAVCSGADGTEASASVTTTLPNDLVVLGVEVRAAEAITATGGDALVTSEEVTGTNANSGAMLDESDSGTGAFTLSATFTSAEYAALAVALKPSLPLTPGTVSPASASVDAGQTLALTSTAASSGSGSYDYQWYTGSATCGAGSAITGATGLDYTTPALSAGTDYYCVEDSDSETGETAYTNVADVTVNTALSAHVTPSAPSIDQSQSVTLTVSASGGTGSDTYQWYGDAGCTGTVLGTSTTLDTGSLTASQTFCAAVTDSAYVPATVSTTDTVTVSSSTLSATITPAAPAIDTGQSVNLTAEPSGGTGPYSYAWYAGSTCGVGSVLATAQVYTTPSLSSDESYCVTVTDSSYEPVSTSATVSVSVGSASLSVTILPVTPGIDDGQSIQLTASPAGGTAPYTYVWHEYDGSCSGASIGTSQTFTTPDLTSTTEYCVIVTDSSAEPEQDIASDTVVVSATLSAAITPAGPDLDLDQNLLLTAVPSGGTGSDSFSWYVGATCTGSVLATTTTYQTSDLSATTSYCVAVTDSAHNPITVTSTDTVTVSAAALSVGVAPSTPTIDPGQQVELTATPSGGTSPDSYAWYAGLSCSGTIVGTSVSFTTPALASSQSYCALVTDSSYEPVSVSATATVTVSSSGLSVSITPADPSIDTGQSLTLSANPVGGTSPDSVSWYQGGSCSGTVLATSVQYTTPVLTSTSTYCVAVTDSSADPATATATDTVTVSSSALSASITPQAPAIDQGQSITLTAAPTGGINPDGFAWFAGSTCVGSVLATTAAFVTPELSTTSTYCVSVTDNATSPTTVNATDTVTVSPAVLAAHVTPEGPSIDFGQSLTLTASASGGTGTDTFAWYIGSSCSGSVAGTGTSYHTEALEATTSFCVAATDSAYSPETATATTTLTTSAAALSLSVTPTSPSVKSGQSATLTAVASGGTGSDSFAWYADAACTGTVVGTADSFTTPALTAKASYCVATTDSSAVPVTATAAVEVAVTATTPTGPAPGAGSSPSFLASDWWVFPLLAVIVLSLVLTVAWRRRRPGPSRFTDSESPPGPAPGGTGTSASVTPATEGLATAPSSPAPTGVSAAVEPTIGPQTSGAPLTSDAASVPTEYIPVPLSSVGGGTPGELGEAPAAVPQAFESDKATPLPTTEASSEPDAVLDSTPEPVTAPPVEPLVETRPPEVAESPVEPAQPPSLPEATVVPSTVPDPEIPAPADPGIGAALTGAEIAPASSEVPVPVPESTSVSPSPTPVFEQPPLPTQFSQDPVPSVPSTLEVATTATEPEAAELPVSGSSLGPDPSPAPAPDSAQGNIAAFEDIEVPVPPPVSEPVAPNLDSVTAHPAGAPIDAAPREAEYSAPDAPLIEAPGTEPPTVNAEEVLPSEKLTPPPEPSPGPVELPLTEPAPLGGPEPAEEPTVVSSPEPPSMSLFSNWEAPVAPETPNVVPASDDPLSPAEPPADVASSPPSSEGAAAPQPIALGPGPQQEAPQPTSMQDPSGELLPPVRRPAMADWLFKNKEQDGDAQE